MSYKTYTTEAIVCGSRVNNTSDKSYLLFTRDAGMLWASAKSVREERSRQRYALQDFALIKVSLVRGKSGWRIGSAESESNFFVNAPTKQARGAIVSILKLLRQFLHGEISHSRIFEDVKQALKLLSAAEGQNFEVEKLVEIFSLRLLHGLGYVASSVAIEDHLSSPNWWDLPPLDKSALVAIEKAKSVSHL